MARILDSSFVYFPFGVGHRSCIGKHLQWYDCGNCHTLNIQKIHVDGGKVLLARLFQTYKAARFLLHKLAQYSQQHCSQDAVVPCRLTLRSSNQ